MGTITWQSTQSFSLSLPPSGVFVPIDLLAVPAGKAPSSGATLFVVYAAADLAGNLVSSSGQNRWFVDSIGVTTQLINTGGGVNTQLDHGGVGLIAGSIDSSQHAKSPFMDLNGGGNIRLSFDQVSGSAVTVTGVLAAAIFDTAGATDNFDRVLKTTANANSGTIATGSPPAGKTYLGFIATAGDVTANPPSSSPAALLPDFSGGGTTNWVNVAQIASGILYAGIGYLATVAGGPTNPYAFTNMSAVNYAGSNIVGLTAPAALGSWGWTAVIG